jgi:murein DD-endopeptidase MepM/ murein hydrolase activator NlpD
LASPSAQTTDEEAPAGAHVVFGRALDLVGQPVDILRPIGGNATAPLSLASIPAGMPVAARAVTSGFGLRLHPILGRLREHMGVDLAAPIGTPVVATTDGTVGWANWRGGYGLSVSIDGGGSIQTRYGHMSRLNVVSGERVRRGEVIGYVGSTGLSTGPHLHYEVRVNGRPVNPLRRRGR